MELLMREDEMIESGWGPWGIVCDCPSDFY
jgi:hypothetical protein